MSAIPTAPMHNVAGKIAFITGGSSGIGLGIAHAFIDAGMKVVITYQSRANLDAALRALPDIGDRLHAVKLDVTDRAAVASAAQETERVFGKIHVLVNNAGVATIVPLSSATFDDWDWCMQVNVNGVFNCIQAFLPHIRRHGEGGHIVSTSSMLGGIVVGPFWGVYSTTKFAVVGMMEALRSELAEQNIGVSIFCPAGVKTNLGSSSRNRPAKLAASGESDPHAAALMSEFIRASTSILAGPEESQPLMSSEEAGRRVLAGIKNNDLYILSHPEYEQVIRERNEALLVSIPIEPSLPSGRHALAEISRTRIYADEIERKRMTARES
jgi:NAD(P)-dependent dehydrogenase (short-subunit alcohol dehydrogenase family)